MYNYNVILAVKCVMRKILSGVKNIGEKSVCRCDACERVSKDTILQQL